MKEDRVGRITRQEVRIVGRKEVRKVFNSKESKEEL
jgi:hypothetical protein